MLQLLENNGILTLGMDSRDIDWQRTWRTQLDKDDRPGGEGASICPHLNTPNADKSQLSPALQTHKAWIYLRRGKHALSCKHSHMSRSVLLKIACRAGASIRLQQGIKCIS